MDSKATNHAESTVVFLAIASPQQDLRSLLSSEDDILCQSAEYCGYD